MGLFMKEQIFDYSKARYDQYKRFYQENNRFITFESGETICTIGHAYPERRILYSALGVRIFSSDEIPWALKTMNGEQIKAAWVQPSSAALYLADLELRVIVCLDSPIIPHPRMSAIPKSLYRTHVSVYWPNFDSLPIAEGITINKPFKPSEDERKYLKEVLLVAKVSALPDPLHTSSINVDAALTPQSIRKYITDNRNPSDFVFELSHNAHKQLQNMGLHAFERDKCEEQYITWD